MEVSCLLPVHAGAVSPHVNCAIKSIVDQTRQPDKLLLLRDGPVPKPLQDDLERWSTGHDWIKLIESEENRGIAATLRDGVDMAAGEIIARMDADDISVEDRFDRQLSFLEENPEVDVIGGWIEEFGVGDGAAIRKVPESHAEIVQFAQHRSPMNHVSVMMRPDAMLAAGNYRDMSPTEDYDLWMRMLLEGATFANLPEVLVRVRGDNEMYRRRGGLEYAAHEVRQYHKFVAMGAMSLSQAMKNLLIRTPVRLLPTWARRRVYKQFVRS